MLGTLRRVRIRIRTLMIAVAIVALATFAAQTWRRHRDYRGLAVYHAGRHRELTTVLDEGQRERRRAEGEADRPGLTSAQIAIWRGVADTKRAQSAYCRKLVEWHDHLAEKYRRAARTPWRSVPPDPEDPPA